MTEPTVNSNLRVSIVVPVRNRPELLKRTLDSLAEQDFPRSDYEIIVCDDGSTDDIGTVISQASSCGAQIRLERQPPRGPASARNMGIRTSLAPLVLFIDSDVIVDASAVRNLVEAIDSHTDWLGAEAALVPCGEPSGILWDAPTAQNGGRYHTAAILYRKETLCAVGGFDEDFDLPACEDVEIAMRILSQGTIGFVPSARVLHPRRRVTLSRHWQWRRYWRFETIIALRYGILAFPGKRCGQFPRLRIARSALISLPAGRILTALRAFSKEPADSLAALLYAFFDVVCGLSALPGIVAQPLPKRLNYLQCPQRSCESQVP